MPTRAVDKAIAVLKEFSSSEPELGVSDLARRLHLSKSTVHSILASLRQGGLVEQDPSTRKYRLGMELLELGNVVTYSDPLLSAALPYLHYLADRLGESVYLGARRGDQVVTLLHVMSPDLREQIGWSRSVPLHSTASGKILLADADESDLEAFLSKGLERHTKHTTTEAAQLRRELEEVRQQGFAVCFEELKAGFNAIAVPVADPQGQVIAALAVLGPAYSLTRDKAMDSLERLTAISTEITQKLG